MITELTKQQEDQMPIYADKWVKNGLSTDRLKLSEVRPKINGFYEYVLKKKPPQIILLMDDPLQAYLAVMLCAQVNCQAGKNDLSIGYFKEQVMDHVWDQVKAQVWERAENQVVAQVGDQVKAQAEDHIRDQINFQAKVLSQSQFEARVCNHVWEKVEAQVRDHVHAQVVDKVRPKIWNQARAQVGDQVKAQAENQVVDKVWDQVGDQADKQVWAQVWFYIEAQVREQVGDQLRNYVRDQFLDQAIVQVKEQTREQVGPQVAATAVDQVWAQVYNQIVDQVLTQVRTRIETQAMNQVKAQVKGHVWNQVMGQVEGHVWDQVIGQIKEQTNGQVKNQFKDFFFPYFEGSFFSNWYAFFDYMEQVVGIDFSGIKGYSHFKKCCDLGPVYPLDDFCVVSQKPTHIKFVDGKLHSDGSPSIEYAGGYVKVWSLNGVRVPQWLAETPGDQIDVSMIKEIANDEVRREFIRKVGYERLYYKLGGKTLDKQNILISNGDDVFRHKYEVIQLDVGGETAWTMLKMINPSLSTPENEIIHIEGVLDDCDTVEKALHFRKPDWFKEYPISSNGANWYQQGDVVIAPAEKVSVKPLPVVLT